MMSTTEVDLDVEVSNEREEGELDDSDVEEGTYIPLTRPEAFNPPSLVHMQIQDEQSDEASSHETTGSDSDEEPRRRPKRTKLRPRRPQPQGPAEKKNKYNVWCKALQEDLLTEDMVSCDVTKKSDYGVESYDYTIKYRLDDNYISKKVFTNDKDSDRTSNKRRNMDRSNVKLRLGKRVNSNQEFVKQNPRFLPDLLATPLDPIDVIANEIAEKLSEDKKELIGVIDFIVVKCQKEVAKLKIELKNRGTKATGTKEKLIERIVQVLGVHKAMAIYKETQRIEADGGMLVMNGNRRRTPGGVYFFLLKREDDVSQEMVNQIFIEDRKETARKIKKSRAKTREKVMEQLKQSLTESELPALLSRGEAAVQSEHGSNPPPSPATDARECSSDTDAPPSPARPPAPSPERGGEPRNIPAYEDDDFLEVMCNDDMDLF